MKTFLACGVLAATFASGCEGGQVPALDSEALTRTVVMLRGDEPPVVLSHEIFSSNDVEAREGLAVAHQGIFQVTVPGACDTNGCVSLYSSTSFGGSSIVFAGSGTADLSAYGWGGAIRAWQTNSLAGAPTGKFSKFAIGGCSENYTYNTATPVASACVQTADRLKIN